MPSLRTSIFTIFLVAGIVGLSAAQTSFHRVDFSRLLKDKKASAFNRAASIKDGAIIVLDEQPDAGILWIDNFDFEQGIIELKIKGKDVMAQSFVGIAFHGIDNTHYDAVYLRPFNFKSPDSLRRSHSIQYISNPNFPWEKLRDESPGIYENALSPPPDPNEWFKVKLVISRSNIQASINDATPALNVEKLGQNVGKKIGLWVGNNSGGSFSDLTITKN